jgi:hypothetical protein
MKLRALNDVWNTLAAWDDDDDVFYCSFRNET